MTNSKNKIVRTTTWSAGPGCHGGCGVLAHIKDGKLVKIEGDPDHPMNQGRLCARALAMTQYVDHPDRYKDPRYTPPECMIIWGYNIHATCPDNQFGHWIVDLMKRRNQDHLH